MDIKACHTALGRAIAYSGNTKKTITAFYVRQANKMEIDTLKKAWAFDTMAYFAYRQQDSLAVGIPGMPAKDAASWKYEKISDPHAAAQATPLSLIAVPEDEAQTRESINKEIEDVDNRLQKIKEEALEDKKKELSSKLKKIK